MMLWEALHECRCLPFSRYESLDLRKGLHLELNERPAIPWDWEEECPGVEQLLQDCWEQHPRHRPTSLEVVERLLDIIANMED
jgi:hypothetical protein